MSSEASSLRALESAFFGHLTGLAPLGKRAVRTLVAPPPAGDRTTRVAVYAHGYVARIAEALGGEHPATRAILGAPSFDALVHRYLLRFPPRSHDLARAGDRLPEFLVGEALGREMPFLTDLVALERAVAAAFTAGDARPLAWEDLLSRGPEESMALRFRAAPGAALFRSAWPLLDLWDCRSAAEDDPIDVDLVGRAEAVFVFRPREAVRVEAVSEAEASFVDAVLGGAATLGDVCERLVPSENPECTSSFVETFRALVARGVITNAGAPEGAGPIL